MIKRLLFMLLLIPSVAFAWQGKVVSVVDGDGLYNEGYKNEIRLHVADCFENSKKNPEQPFSGKAKELTEMMVLNKQVIITEKQYSQSHNRILSCLYNHLFWWSILYTVFLP